jgi:hypothetical protein
MYQQVENAAHPLGCATHELWDQILGLIEQDLDERRSRRLLVEVRGESGPSQKEIGELSAEERKSLRPTLGEQVVEQLIDRYLAEQGRVDLVEKRRTYTKKMQDLTAEDSPALVEADRLRIKEEHRKERERAEFVQEVRADLRHLPVVELAGMMEAGKEV